MVIPLPPRNKIKIHETAKTSSQNIHIPIELNTNEAYYRTLNTRPEMLVASTAAAGAAAAVNTNDAQDHD